jgi:hypothetical protein
VPVLLIPCPVCSAAVEPGDNAHGHIGWHDRTRTLGDWTLAGAVYAVEQAHDEALAAAAPAARDDAPTQKLPPIGETVRRRPPVPPALVPGTPDQWRALAAAMEDDGLDVEDLADEVRDAGGVPSGVRVPLCGECGHALGGHYVACSKR